MNKTISLGDHVRLRDHVDGFARDLIGDSVCEIRSLERDDDGILWAGIETAGIRATILLGYLEFAVTCDHHGCLESVEVARDCWLSRRPTTLEAP